MRLLRAADRVAVPWKNGGGVTRDVIVSPAGATMDDFDWRISIAEIASSGPFSRFPGIDRKLAVLEGEVVLTVEGNAPAVLDPHSAALDFHGESAVQADLVGGPSMDLNVMTRRGKFNSKLNILSDTQLYIRNVQTIVITMTSLKITRAGEAIPMARLDALLIEEPAALTVVPAGADYYLIEISAATSPVLFAPSSG
jgi:environmental stress-induced protein Ves